MNTIIRNQYFIFSVICAFISLIIFFVIVDKITVIGLLLMLILPMLVNIIMSALTTHSIRSVNPFYITVAYSIINLIQVVFLGCYFNFTNKLNLIYERSTLYSSEYLTVAPDNSPILSGLLIILFFFGLYYFVSKKVIKINTLRESRR